MSDLDFYAHVAMRGDVLGTGIGTPPEAWDASVGRDCHDDFGKGRLRRDYGLVELSFSRVEGSLSCFGIGLQVHRLVHGLSVPASLTAEYGAFAPRVRFAELRAVLASLGSTVEPDDLTGDVHRFRVAGSGVRVFVVDDPDPYGDGDHDADDRTAHQAGDVWALSVSPGWWKPAEQVKRGNGREGAAARP
ncbi:hypothetical protein [Streptomyces sp. AM 2-1-1]|uniref:hypothetical protein n=1 Tax=unclassified Streptomyces TaxID=2593676 RepID=UPI0023BA1AFF|nr:hypothetical protein [Streptomyces sp. AM 2-1-1]WEH38738.1 hypothetical protein PZB77_04005 [Streptomyces sp. AM 2-1-1]